MACHSAKATQLGAVAQRSDPVVLLYPELRGAHSPAEPGFTFRVAGSHREIRSASTPPSVGTLTFSVSLEPSRRASPNPALRLSGVEGNSFLQVLNASIFEKDLVCLWASDSPSVNGHKIALASEEQTEPV